MRWPKGDLTAVRDGQNGGHRKVRALERKGSLKIKRGEEENERSHMIVSLINVFIWELIEERGNVTNIARLVTPINELGSYAH